MIKSVVIMGGEHYRERFADEEGLCSAYQYYAHVFEDGHVLWKETVPPEEGTHVVPYQVRDSGHGNIVMAGMEVPERIRLLLEEELGMTFPVPMTMKRLRKAAAEYAHNRSREW